MSQDNKDFNVDLMFPSKYLKAADLSPEGQSFTILKVGKEDMKLADNTSKKSFLLTLKEADKAFVLNKTNAVQIAKLLGDKRAVNWAGKRICLYPTKCDAFGQTVDCIRVRADGQQAATPTPPPAAAPSPTPPAPTTHPNTIACPKCGAEAVLQTKTNRTTKKDFDAYYCTKCKNDKGWPTMIPTTQAPPTKAVEDPELKSFQQLCARMMEEKAISKDAMKKLILEFSEGNVKTSADLPADKRTAFMDFLYSRYGGDAPAMPEDNPDVDKF